MDHNTFISGLARQLRKQPQEIEALTESIAKALKDNAAELNSVAIPGFGRFDITKHDEYIADDPATGRRTLFPPEIKLSFTVGSMLKKRLSHE